MFLHMYVQKYTFTYAYMYILIYAYVFIHTHTSKHVCMYKCRCRHAHIHIHTHTCISSMHTCRYPCVVSGAEETLCRGHVGTVNSVTFSFDDTFIFSCSSADR